MANWTSSLLDALLPRCCEVCGRALVTSEHLICIGCDMAMPRTHYHLESFSDIHHRLAAPGIPIEKAASYFHYYRGNPYAELIKRAKYNSRPDLARELGRRFAIELLPTGFFSDIDRLIPIPLYPSKLWRRGFNQSEEICHGISQATGIPIADNLRTRRHSTQTRKSASQRASNVKGLAYVKHPDELAGMHILVVDDVITTGSTMLDAVSALHAAIDPLKISVLSLAAAKLQ